MPDDPQIIFSKGLILEWHGHRDRAVHYYRKACSIYDSLGAEPYIYMPSIVPHVYKPQAYRKEIKAIWRKHKKNIYKDGTIVRRRLAFIVG